MTTAETLANPQAASLVELGEALLEIDFDEEEALAASTWEEYDRLRTAKGSVFAELARRDAEAGAKGGE